MENNDNNVVGTETEYNNVQWADDLRAMGVNPDTLLLSNLASDGYSITTANGETIIQKTEEMTNYDVLDLSYSNDDVNWFYQEFNNYSIKYDDDKGLFYILRSSSSQSFGNINGPVIQTSKIYITPDNQDYINKFVNEFNTTNSDYDLTITFDVNTSQPVFEKTYSMPQSEYDVLAAVYHGDVLLTSDVDKKDNRIFYYECTEEKFKSLFGSVENAEQLGMKVSINDGRYKFEMAETCSVFQSEINNQYSLISGVNGNSEDNDFYTFTLLEDEFVNYFSGISFYPGIEGADANQVINIYFDDDKERTIENLTPEEKKYLADQGIFIVNNKLYDSFGELFYEGCDFDYFDDGNNCFARVSIPKTAVYSDELLTLLFGTSNYKESIIIASQKSRENQLTNFLNANLSMQLSSNLKTDNLFMFPIDKNGVQSTFGTGNDYVNNELFAVLCDGYSYVIKNDNSDLSLENIATEQIVNMLKNDEKTNDDLGFALSFMINSELNTLPYSDLKNKGYSNVIQCDDGTYKVYLDNGQYYLLDHADSYKISEIVQSVDNCDAMFNLGIQKSLLLNDKFMNSDIDVRTTTDAYEIYIDGNIYSVKREDVEQYDAQGNLITPTDELYTSILKEVKKQYDDDDDAKTTTRNGFVSTNMFTPYIDLKNEEYYRDICTDLNSYSDTLMEYSSRISCIDIAHPFVQSSLKKEKYSSLIVDTAVECTKLSKKIEYCVNLVTQCDISLKDTLDSIIGEFFDEVNENIIIENNTVKVDSQAYIDFFSDKMSEYKEQIPYYNLLIMGKVEVPDKYAEKMMEMGLSLETATIDGNTFYVASKDTISYFVSKTNNVAFNDNYTVFDWISDNIPDELDDSNPDHRFLKNIGMLKLANQDLQGVTRLRNSLDAFCNTEPYLKYICSDEYATVLDRIQNGEEFNFINSIGVVNKYPEYFTDFQKTLLYFVNEEGFESVKKRQELYDSNIARANGRYTGGHSDFLQDFFDENVEKLKNIVPYTYNEIAGYNEALETLASWYEKGGISLGECLVYDLHKLGEGFFEYPVNAFHLIDPEITVNEYKSKYLSEMLSSITSTSEKDIYNMANNGQITEFDKQLRLKMIDDISGLNPDDVQASADVAKSLGVIGSEALLYYLAGKMPNLPAIVKGASMGGKVSKDVYSKGYSASAARLSGLVSGSVMFLLHSKLINNSNPVVDKFNLGSKTFNYNPLKGKITVKVDWKMLSKKIHESAAEESIKTAANVFGSARNGLTSKVIDWVANGDKNVTNSLITGVVNPLLLATWGGIYDNSSYLGRNIVLGIYDNNDNYVNNNHSSGNTVSDFDYKNTFQFFTGNAPDVLTLFEQSLKEGTKTFTGFIGK